MNETYYFLLLAICFLIGVKVVHHFLIRNSKLGKQALANIDMNVPAIPVSLEGESKLLESINRLEVENNELKEKINSQLQKNESLLKHNEELSAINRELTVQKERLYARKKHLEQLQLRRDELFAMAIHDLKNPAGALKGYVDILRSYDLNAEEQQSIMENLLKLSTRIIEISQSVSTILAEAENTGGVQCKLTFLKPIIDEVCDQNRAYAESKKVTIINNASSSVPPIPLDELKIEKAIENLLSNAIKFAREGTVVVVNSSFDKTNAIIEISDTGVGMTVDDIARAFGRGAKLSAQPTGNETSSGLGLWIVKNIIEAHGGRVLLDSTPGVGTKFTIQLPFQIKKDKNLISGRPERPFVESPSRWDPDLEQ